MDAANFKRIINNDFKFEKGEKNQPPPSSNLEKILKAPIPSTEDDEDESIHMRSDREPISLDDPPSLDEIKENQHQMAPCSQTSSRPSCSQTSSRPSCSQTSSSPSQEKRFDLLRDTNFIEFCATDKMDAAGNIQPNENLLLVPIDFRFNMDSDSICLEKTPNRCQNLKDKDKKKIKISTETPSIYYVKDFKRDDYEKKRLQMFKNNPVQILDKSMFRVKLTRYPRHFILVDISSSKAEVLQSNYPSVSLPKFLEFIQIKPLPTDDLQDDNQNDDPAPTLWKEENEEKLKSWFEIDEKGNFNPETGIYYYEHQKCPL